MLGTGSAYSSNGYEELYCHDSNFILERTGIPVMWASLLGTIPGGIGNIALRGTSAELPDIAMSSSSVTVVISMTVLVELLLSSGKLTNSFGSSAVLSPGTKPGYLCHHTSGRCSGNSEQTNFDDTGTLCNSANWRNSRELKMLQ